MEKNRLFYRIILLIILITIIGILAIKGMNFNSNSNIEEWDEEKLVNIPKLSEGMEPIIFNEKGEAIKVEDSQDWYNYKKQENTTENGGDSMWAKGQTRDGSQWVWIPRFAYKINYNDIEHKENGGNIEIKFLKGNTNLDENNADVTEQGFIVHPAFKNGETTGYTNGEWDKEITGIWVSKFEAGFAGIENTSTSNIQAQETQISYESANSKNIYGIIETGVTKMKYPVFMGGAFSYTGIDIGEMYKLCRNLNVENNPYGVNNESEDIHLMKNSEWGAVAYLAYSAYGRNGTPIAINNIEIENIDIIKTITGYSSKNEDYMINKINYDGNKENYNEKSYIWYTKEGGLASTTGSKYGVFDTAGGTTEYIAGYIENMDSHNEAYLKDFDKIEQSNKYFTIFKSEENKSTYESNKNIYGDATIETSSGNGSYESWDKETSYYITRRSPFFLRGGCFSEGSFAGLFAYSIHSGHSAEDHGFRCVLIVE